MKKEFKTDEDLEKFAKEQYVFKHGRSLEATKRFIRKSWQGYPESVDNIGNLKGATYLSEMLKVYRECHAVLRPSGRMILVTKNFIRDKAVVRLDSDTIKLCEAAGFRLLERHRFKLPQESFWRILYSRKHPDVEKVTHEDVLVFERG